MAAEGPYLSYRNIKCADIQSSNTDSRNHFGAHRIFALAQALAAFIICLA